MDFSRAYFGKPLNDLRFEDIVTYFIEPLQESETIEFKSFHNSESFDTAIPNIIRGISAFLNSSGGILIWGAPKGVKQPGQSEKTFSGSLAPVAIYKEKDTLINKITSNITPMPIGINVVTLHSEDGYVYVFEVQQSTYKPHQYDSRYFVRLDGQTKPAPHYLVEALIKQITYPNLNGIIRFQPISIKQDAFHHNVFSMPIVIGIFNFSEFHNEESVSFRVSCAGGFFERGQAFNKDLYKQKYQRANQELIYDNFADVLHYGTPHIHQDLVIADSVHLKKTSGKLKMSLSFGGRYSPAKSSDYVMDLTTELNLEDPNLKLEQCNENVLFVDQIKELNTTVSAMLADFSGR